MSKSVAIMQPYFFPYIGYFQLINEVDEFILLDDVNYIKKGWINRNNILQPNGDALRITMPLDSPSQNKLICDTQISHTLEWQTKLLKQISHCYKKAPCFDDVYSLIKEILSYETVNLSLFLQNSLEKLVRFIGIETPILRSSTTFDKHALSGQDRIIDIVLKSDASHYLNAPGGKSLYNATDFAKQGITLNFLEPKLVEYDQSQNAFIAGLSIIDVLMFNESSKVLDTMIQLND